MKRNTIIWMAIQAAVFAAAMLMERDMSREAGEPFNVARGTFFGLIGAFGVTALWVDARPRLWAWIKRMISPRRVDVDARAAGLPAVDADHRETGRQGQRLGGPDRSLRDLSERGGSRRIG